MAKKHDAIQLCNEGKPTCGFVLKRKLVKESNISVLALETEENTKRVCSVDPNWAGD